MSDNPFEYEESTELSTLRKWKKRKIQVFDSMSCGFWMLATARNAYTNCNYSLVRVATLMNSLHFPRISLIMLDFLVFFIFWHTCKHSIFQHHHHHYSSGAILQLISSSKLQSPIQWNNGGIMSFHFWDVLQNKSSTKAKCCHNILLQCWYITFFLKKKSPCWKEIPREKFF